MGQGEDRKPAREGRAPALPKFASNVVSPGNKLWAQIWGILVKWGSATIRYRVRDMGQRMTVKLGGLDEILIDIFTVTLIS